MAEKVFVSGCFDPLHEGHIAFFETASKYGEVYVAVGSDATIRELKKRAPFRPQEARVYHVKSIKFVKDAFIASGIGMLDFEKELREMRPKYLIVNKDGDRVEKRKLCQELGVEYIVLDRIPNPGLAHISSTELRGLTSTIPFRLDIAGGWLDQPFVSKHCSGSVLAISLEPNHQFNNRSGMASSTRNKAIRIWGSSLLGRDEESAKVLFGYENLPGTKEVAGSQDAIGIVMPGLKRMGYSDGEYWPREIESVVDRGTLDWLESVIYLVPLKPREGNFKVLDETKISKEGAEALANASEECFKALMKKDVKEFGKWMTKSFEAQVKMFPLMTNEFVQNEIDKYKGLAYGWKISGAGGGGYLVLVSDKVIDGAIRIKVSA